MLGELIQGKRDGSTPDEDFAWDSRDFLRRMCIGKVHVCVWLCSLNGLPIYNDVKSNTCIYYLNISISTIYIYIYTERS